MLNFNEISQTPSEICQHKSKLHYLQVLYIFLVFSVGTTEVSFFLATARYCCCWTRLLSSLPQ